MNCSVWGAKRGWEGGGGRKEGEQLGRMGCRLVLLPALPKQNCYPKAETSALFLPRVYKAAASQVIDWDTFVSFELPQTSNTGIDTGAYKYK